MLSGHFDPLASLGAGRRLAVRDKIHFRFDLLIFILAVAVVVNSQFDGLVNPYVINPDSFQHTYWMQQFRDKELFRDDLLTDYAKSMQPWGLIGFYWLSSHIADPLVIAKIVPLILMPVSSLYLFRLVCRFAHVYVAFMASLLFILSPVFLSIVVGGHARAFALPLLIIFLYYLVTRDDRKCRLVLIVQSLFHPMSFLVGGLTYLLSFIEFRDKRLFWRASPSKVASAAATLILGLAILAGNYVLRINSSVGSLVLQGRVRGLTAAPAVLDLASLPSMGPLVKSIVSHAIVPFTSILVRYPEALKRMKPGPYTDIAVIGALSALAVVLAGAILKGRLSLPRELLYVLAAGVVWYKIAELARYRLYIPDRYLLVVPVLSVILFSLGVYQLLCKLDLQKWSGPTIVATFFFISLHFNLSKGVGLSDFSARYYYDNAALISSMSLSNRLYSYLGQLPKDVLIAAHPSLANPIPAFSARKVLVNAELFRPWPDQYWRAVKQRTVDFFRAYYAEELSEVYGFCNTYGVDYLVVDRRHFQDPYLTEQRLYPGQFTRYIRDLIGESKDYALARIPAKDTLFDEGNVFVIACRGPTKR